MILMLNIDLKIFWHVREGAEIKQGIEITGNARVTESKKDTVVSGGNATQIARVACEKEA